MSARPSAAAGRRRIDRHQSLPFCGEVLDLTAGEGGTCIAYRVAEIVVWNTWANAQTAAELRAAADALDALLPAEVTP